MCFSFKRWCKNRLNRVQQDGNPNQNLDETVNQNIAEEANNPQGMMQPTMPNMPNTNNQQAGLENVHPLGGVRRFRRRANRNQAPNNPLDIQQAPLEDHNQMNQDMDQNALIDEDIRENNIDDDAPQEVVNYNFDLNYQDNVNPRLAQFRREHEIDDLVMNGNDNLLDFSPNNTSTVPNDVPLDETLGFRGIDKNLAPIEEETQGS